MTYFDWDSIETKTDVCNCGSYLVVKNKQGEACVCSGVRKCNGENYYSQHKVGDYFLSAYIAGNLSTLNPVECSFETIGKKALIGIRVEFNNHTFIIFYTKTNSSIQEIIKIKSYYGALNCGGEIGDIEKDIINLYNSKVPYWKQVKLSSVGFCDFLSMYFGVYSTNPFYLRPLEREEKYFPLRNIKEFNDLIEEHVVFSEVFLIDNINRLEKEIRLIEELQITNSSLHRIKFLGYCTVEILTPINWYTVDYRHDFDGYFERHHGKRNKCRLHFCHEVLYQNFRKKFIDECEKADILLSILSKDDYLFSGTVNLDFEEEEVEIDNYYEHGFELQDW
jgi:hypothetical protein